MKERREGGEKRYPADLEEPWAYLDSRNLECSPGQNKSRVISPLICHARNNTLRVCLCAPVRCWPSFNIGKSRERKISSQTGVCPVPVRVLAPAGRWGNVKYDRERICLHCPRALSERGETTFTLVGEARAVFSAMGLWDYVGPRLLWGGGCRMMDAVSISRTAPGPTLLTVVRSS